MKLYVLIRNDLSDSQMAVQAGHVVAKYAAKNHQINWDKQIFVYIKITKYKLYKCMLKLTLDSKYFEIFREPDIGNKITAIACLCDDDTFKRYKLF